ncbi:MAG: helix-turn-helix domain-containing protein, partial [Phycisphaerae bacterium]
MLQHGGTSVQMPGNFFNEPLLQEAKPYEIHGTSVQTSAIGQPVILPNTPMQQPIEIEESLNIMDKEKELIIRALKKHKGKRRDAAVDLGISERTL